MNKLEFLDTLRTEHAEWEQVLDQAGESRMIESGVIGEWSVKDIIAHVTWFEREMVGMLRAHALVGSDLWNLTQDQRNAAVYEQNKQRLLPDVLSEAREVYQQLVDALESLDEQDLDDSSRFANMPADWQPGQVIVGNTYKHYREHGADIRGWLQKRPAFQTG